jgi:hypothetical protein
VASQKIHRKGRTKTIWPEVQAISKYRNGLFNFYHGFHQADRMDRQELKLVFETGDITLHEWVPSRMVLNGLVSLEALEELKALFPEAGINILESFHGRERKYISHFSDRIADCRISMVSGDDSMKLTIYQDLLTAMMEDQTSWLRDRKHQRRITEVNGLNSLQMAELANNRAVKL